MRWRASSLKLIHRILMVSLPRYLQCITECISHLSYIECISFSYAGSIPFMEGPHEMESEQIESVTTNTDDILSSVPERCSHTLQSTSKSFPRSDRKIRKLKTTINSLRYKI
ncbi:uncharacterized protein LOC123306380 [Coccinella septempunctata]|uniref:uncharacterized protein LOC123306380 n=1 Tax=Coccinella septempunctata TaxID=41139 RepID=UPI001D067267|nr:uncharacterized protein LOC123306380 [Coccinella septempunctata]